MRVRASVIAAMLTGALLLSACGSSSTHHSTTTTATPVAQNLVVTSSVRASLLAAGAKSHGLTSADYTGLYPHSVFYAHDPKTGYWAGASLDPSPSSYQAQVSSQDDGSYLLFHRATKNDAWTVYQVGLAGFDGATCPATPPAAVLTLWGWKADTCRWSGS